MKWPICGPKLSLCCSIISVWGVIQFLLMGIFFFVQAAPLMDDFEFDAKSFKTTSELEQKLRDAFQQRAYNCWIAAFLYVALLVFAGMQFMTNLKKTSSPTVPTSITSPFTGVTTEENGYNHHRGIQYSVNESET